MKKKHYLITGGLGFIGSAISNNLLKQGNKVTIFDNLSRGNKKRIVNTGYFYFDYLKEKFNYKEIHQEVLIAPSWNYSQNNFLNENFIDLINVLLKKGEKVIFRPHPEHLKRVKD